MNRIATMGQLTASIAHEVNQPIAATIMSAQAALRWLDAQPPDPDKARLSKRLGGDFGGAQTCPAAPNLTSQCPPTRAAHRDWTPSPAGLRGPFGAEQR